jgi:hypothetical protein
VKANVTQAARGLFRQKPSTPRRVVKRGSDTRRLGKCGWNVKLNIRLNPIPRTELYVYWVWQVNKLSASVKESVLSLVTSKCVHLHEFSLLDTRSYVYIVWKFSCKSFSDSSINTVIKQI